MAKSTSVPKGLLMIFIQEVFMTYSKYNHLCKLSGSDNYLLYNFLTGALLELDEDAQRRFNDITLLSSDEKKLLIENGFLIENFDELQYLKYGNKLACADPELLSILIAPTMACNFRCPYCFEHHGAGMMSEEVQDAIISFIENSVREHHHKHLFVYWFGGEPLLGISIIEKMAERILEIVENYQLSYSSAMSSNGYYLTESSLRILEKCRLDRIQITLDGMRELNDKTRVLANGDGTFNVIVSNLQKAHTGIEIHIRTNLTKQNAGEFSKLNALVKDIRRTNNINISLYGAHMSVYEFNNENVDDLELSIQEFSNVLRKNNILGAGSRTKCKFTFCDAAKTFSYCFDEKGYMYKCWNDIGNPEFAYDNVLEANHRGINYLCKNALDYLGDSFPDECADCLVLPICMGGCIKKRVVEHHKTCSPVKYNLDDYVNKKYKMKLGGEINDSGY